MRNDVVIRPANAGDSAEIEHLCRSGEQWRQARKCLLDRCLLLARRGEALQALAGLDLDAVAIRPLVIRAQNDGQLLVRRLLAAVERRAVQFMLLELTVEPPKSAAPWFRSCGYEPPTGPAAANSLKRTFRRRKTRFLREIADMHATLGIGAGYALKHRMPLQPEAGRLVSIGKDVFDREQRMLPAAAKSWLGMRSRAAEEGVAVQAVSAFRSVEYQSDIVRRKLRKGQSIENILTVSAAPGFSEHHTGRAVDVTTPGFKVLEEEFENSRAFRWLRDHAAEFGFRMSFPRDNRHGVCYEPWHWAWWPGHAQGQSVE